MCALALGSSDGTCAAVVPRQRMWDTFVSDSEARLFRRRDRKKAALHVVLLARCGWRVFRCAWYHFQASADRLRRTGLDLLLRYSSSIYM